MEKIRSGKNHLFIAEFKILFLLLFFLLSIGLIGQLSASNGIFDSSVQKHLIRIFAGIICLSVVYFCNLRFFYSYAYIFYIIALFALIIVDILGVIRLGAQRWINLGIFTIQPSEPMKIALILALARYYSMLTFIEIREIRNHFIPCLLIFVPSLLVLKQPDLGSAFLLFSTGLGVVFLSGFSKRIFAVTSGICALACPFSWFFLHDYQKNRILTFLDPDRDPCGTGYHVLQSKIAIGSGGLRGKGFLCSTQSKLDFLPEKNTDFIFTTITEEFGFIGGLVIISLFLGLIFYFFWAAVKEKTIFSKLLCGGLGILLFLHIFVNIAMVMGLLPVVGIPLPFLSYGGSSMLTFMVSCGLVMSALADKKN